MTMNGRSLRDERGFAMVYVVLVMMVMSSIAFVTLESIQHEQTTSYSQTNKQTAYQAAEAGIDDYLAKMKDNPQYYGQAVHMAESTRRDLPTSTNVAAATGCTATSKPTAPAWAYATVLAAPAGGSPAGAPEWSYPNGKDRWCQTVNGYEYNLQITPPTASNPTVTIVSTGRKTGATNTKDSRVIQEVMSPNSIVRYYRIVNTSVTFADVTTTNGLVFANQSITHHGTATADLFAGNSITISPQSPGIGLTNGATANPNQPTINFGGFLASLGDIKRAAGVNSPSTDFEDATRDAWKLVFSSAGTYTAQACDMNGGSAVYLVSPTTNCASALGPYTVPTNGAIYSTQDVIVSGTVKGRVTVASNNNIIVGGALNPNTPGTDVIGLNALNDLWVADYVPTTLTWSASIIAQNGTWQAATTGTNHTVLTFRGMAVTQDGGSFGEWTGTHDYGYDANLTFLIPPWFPSLGSPWISTLFRELPPS